MSSAEDESDTGKRSAAQPNKKRRIQRLQRACDVCRRKKIRCDWAVARGNKCTYCRSHDLECNYTHGTREEKQGISEAYVEGLESCVKKMTAYFNRCYPEVDLSKEFGLPSDLDGWMRGRKLPDESTSAFLSSEPGPSAINLVPSIKDEENSSDEDAFKLSDVQDRLQDLHIIDRFLGQASVLGKSSSVALIKTALDMKLDAPHRSSATLANMRSRRGEFWVPKSWEIDTSQNFDPRLHDFPPSDLLYSLIDLYFKTRHQIYPVLHQPTFMKNLADGLHYREGAFAGVVLMVCACASRYSNDPRVIYPGTDSWISAGWQWFIRARTYHQVSLSSPSLHDVQMYCLGCAYLEGTSMPQACWTLCGTAIRLAQDVGAHRKKAYQSTPTVEDELWKRAFWALVLIDRWLSSQLGRTCAIQDEEFDLDYPTDCDDEYWISEDPAQAFKQPPGKPSRVSFFIALLKLNKILGMAMRTIFAMTNKSNLLLELIGPKWEQRVVSAIDSALNEWVDTIPDHLKWNPDREEEIPMLQSACLYTSYYELQISIHRCFIPTPQKPSPVTFPSLAICTNAARSCCHIIECARTKLPMIWRQHVFGMPAFTSALVLLLSIFGARRNGMVIDTSKDMERVYVCMQSVKEGEARWALAPRLWDILYDLSHVGDLPLPNEPSPPDSSVHAGVASGSSTASSHSTNLPQSPPSFPSSSQPSPVPAYPYLNADTQYMLLTHSNDLGRLPVHLLSNPLALSADSSSQHPFNAPYVPEMSSMFAGPSSSTGLPFGADPNTSDNLGDMMNGMWSGAGVPLSTSSQLNLAQLLVPLGNNQQPLTGGSDNWSNMPLGFRLDGWESYLSSLSSSLKAPGHSGSMHPHSSPTSEETNVVLGQNIDPLFNIF